MTRITFVNAVNKSTGPFIILILILMLFVAYDRYYIRNDFDLYAQVSCDPEIEDCFVYQCDADLDTDCSPITEEQYTYYKVIYKDARTAPDCNAWGGDCEELSCSEEDSGCVVIYCSDETMVDYQELDFCG